MGSHNFVIATRKQCNVPNEEVSKRVGWISEDDVLTYGISNSNNKVTLIYK